jgi:hypothetical protein
MSGKSFADCLQGQLMPILVQKSRARASCDTVLLAWPMRRGFRAASADLLIGPRRDPQYGPGGMAMGPAIGICG